MVIKVGINGFGRVGRVVFRTCLQNSDLEISAINDPAVDVEYICYLVKFDSTHGKFRGNVTHNGNDIKIDGNQIKVFHQKCPPSIPWHSAGVQYVVEASGMFTSLEKASGHLASDSVKRVIVTAPSVDVPMVILGVNDNKINAEQRVISCGSSTLYCLAPIIKVLEDRFGVEDGFVTSIHAMTPSLKPLDGLCLRGKHWRDHRSIHQNIIPATTGACKALGKIIPAVRDKMSGLAFRVPIVNVSVLDLTVRLTRQTTLHDIFKSVESESNSTMQNIIKISKDEAVSSDFAGDSYSCILDADSSLELKPNYYKLICWYENEYSYACRVIDLIFFSEKQFNLSDLKSKMTYVRPRPLRKQDNVQQTDCCIQGSIIDHVCTEFAPKVISSTPQSSSFKSKSPTRPIFLRKPFTQNSTTNQSNRFNRKKAELFKVWNDDNEVKSSALARQNRNAYFQSCITIGPKNTGHTDCVIAQERLEKVKREFSKMVNITEDLLKKSYNSKLHVSNSSDEPKEVNDIKKIDLEPDKNYYNNAFQTCKNLPTSAMFDVSGDGKMSMSTGDCNDSNISYEKDLSDYSVPISDIRQSFSLDSHNFSSSIVQENTNKSMIATRADISTSTPINSSNNKSEVIVERSSINNLKDQVTKTINTIMGGISKNFQFQSFTSNASYNLTTVCNKEKRDDAMLMTAKNSKNEDIQISKSLQETNHTTNIPPINSINDAKDENHTISEMKANKTSKIYTTSLKVNGKSEDLKASKYLDSQKDTKNSSRCINTNEVQCSKYIVNKITKHVNKNMTNFKLIGEALKRHNILLVNYENQRRDADSQLLDNNVKMNCLTDSDHCEENKIQEHRSCNLETEILNSKTYDLNKKSYTISKDRTDTLRVTNDFHEESHINEVQVNENHEENVFDDRDNEPNGIKVEGGETSEEKIKVYDDTVDELNHGLDVDNYETKCKDLERQIAEDMKNIPDSVMQAADDTSLCSSPQCTNTTLSRDINRDKQDIYDKLDSVSASDSDTSFQIDGRKSQVINIADLTSSLEDLARLDKICRIIEISDELSDKLFSPLYNSDDCGEASDKKWSFKDLCNKINLDEFCNKVFGKTV